jgi:putative mRNA 3-end processing factor
VTAGPHPKTWLEARPEGLHCRPGGFFIDPARPVGVAVVSHGHADHARPGHGTVLATAETLAIMQARLGEGAGGVRRALAYGEVVDLGEVGLWLAPAGHVLGSAQVVVEHRGVRVVYSGDYKRAPDPTCAPFTPVPCDVFVTEATFGLPVFRHPEPSAEIGKLLRSVELFPERCHVVGAYALGKAQRVIALLRQAGWERPIHLHGALLPMCELYRRFGVELGELRPIAAGERGGIRDELKGEIVLAPPSALADRWVRHFPEPVLSLASGWMRVRRRARQRGVELPLVLSDHADWDELLATMVETKAPEVWITHGPEAALAHAARALGLRARALDLVGHAEEGV